MAKIKLYIAKVQSNNSDAAKGTTDNPYTEAEYEAMLNNGTWPGGYVQNLGYCVKEVVISSTYLDSWSSDEPWPSDDSDSWNYDSDPWENSVEAGLTQPSVTGGSGSNNNVGHQAGNDFEGNSGGNNGSSTSYSIFKAVAYLENHAQPYYIKGLCGKCAYAVRMALEAGVLSTMGHPKSACSYDSFLPKLGFYQVDKKNYFPQKGDIIVLEAVDGHPSGHIAMFSRDRWISDFVQQDMWGGSAYRNKAEYTLFRR